MVGDAGAGGTSGIAPAPGAGDAAASKFLKADGSWTTPPVAAGWDGDITDIDIDGGTDIGADLADADLIVVDDGAGGTNKKCAVSRFKTYLDTKTDYDQIWIPAGAMTPSVTDGASADSYEYPTNDVTHDVMLFQGVTADTFSEFSIVMPPSWNRGVLKAKIYWAPGHADADVDEYVSFYLGAVAISNDDTLDVAIGTTQTMIDQHIADNDMHITAASADITVGGTPALGDMIHFKLGRDYDYAGAGSAMDVDARVLGVMIQYVKNQEVSAW
jgi:hypothetical protein